MNENHSSGSERDQLEFEFGAKAYFCSSIKHSIKKDLTASFILSNIYFMF